jgi:hypothetical protein
LLSPEQTLFHSTETIDELTIEHHGPVEIRQTLAGWSLETFVKGEPDRARAIAVHSLSNYVNGRNRSRSHLSVALPLVQAHEGADRWRIRVAVPSVDAEFVATSPRYGKVRLQARNSEILAVIRVPGRPTPLAIQHAETAIRHAIAATRWQPAGGAMLRLHALPSVLPFRSRFEVAIAVVERPGSSATADWMRHSGLAYGSVRESATQSAPLVR